MSRTDEQVRLLLEATHGLTSEEMDAAMAKHEDGSCPGCGRKIVSPVEGDWVHGTRWCSHCGGWGRTS